MRTTTRHQIRLGDRQIDYRVVHSPAAQRLRVRVGPNGVDVVKPRARNADDIQMFLEKHAPWLTREIARIERLRKLRRPEQFRTGSILYRGEVTPIRIEIVPTRSGSNSVSHEHGELVVRVGPSARTPAARSLENWLRKQARFVIEKHLNEIAGRLRQRPNRVYVMGQRTKWGNCSARRNLSFNWRLILAPEPVLRYLVTHEAVHLAVPDHSAKFWLTVQGVCRDTERAKQWLAANGHRLVVDMAQVCASAPHGGCQGKKSRRAST